MLRHFDCGCEVFSIIVTQDDLTPDVGADDTEFFEMLYCDYCDLYVSENDCEKDE